MMTTPLLTTALALYKAPFRYHRGYILDATGEHVADDPAINAACRIRGWGRISYLETPEALQDKIGEMIAEALTDYWLKQEAAQTAMRVIAMSGMFGELDTAGIVIRLRCWWFGCEQHPQDAAPPDYASCMHCNRCVPYGDMVGDTLHNRVTGLLSYWMWWRWVPAKCPACGAWIGHRGDCDGLPF